MKEVELGKTEVVMVFESGGTMRWVKLFKHRAQAEEWILQQQHPSMYAVLTMDVYGVAH